MEEKKAQLNTVEIQEKTSRQFKLWAKKTVHIRLKFCTGTVVNFVAKILHTHT